MRKVNQVELSKEQMMKVNALAGSRPGVNIGLTGAIAVKRGSDPLGPLADNNNTENSIKTNSQYTYNNFDNMSMDESTPVMFPDSYEKNGKQEPSIGQTKAPFDHSALLIYGTESPTRTDKEIDAQFNGLEIHSAEKSKFDTVVPAFSNDNAARSGSRPRPNMKLDLSKILLDREKQN